MRVGKNPNYYENAETFPRIVLAVITHLPNRIGYHAHRFDVVKTCLMDLADAETADTRVMVWDNGSDGQFRDWLRLDYRPDYLVLSPNVGKQAARAAIANMLPPETILSLCDDDFTFADGWLDAHLQILNTFPNVGAVSGFAARYSFRWGIESTLDWARRHAELQIGRFLTDASEAEYARGIGADAARLKVKHATDKDYLVTYKGLSAYAQAQHAQFVTIAGRIAPLCQYKSSAMGEERSFDETIDKAGLLRLATTKQYTRHMGNVLDK